MDLNLQVIQGPSVEKVSTREEAERSLRSHPMFPKTASVSLEAINGHWVAAIATPQIVKESAPPPAPPSGKPGVDASGKQHVVHERSLKPGEAPPGTTPIGSPSFAHVKGHPWEEDIRQGAKEILLEDVQGDDSIGVIASELRGLAEPVGYRVEQITPFDRGGVRHVRAKVVKV
jgi:hypothetical protein